MSTWYKTVEGGLEISVRLTPAGAADKVEGLVTDDAGRSRLKARVRAVAENNKANRALEALIAKRLKIAKSLVRVASGATNRNKILRIDYDPQDLVGKLDELAGTGGC
ncbi:DUF167 family protein [Hoeflea sp.]|uniref:DUF167 family protein n=1 Tax=Hoeflea sp. TaxID=1940281 RepID=UPI003B51E49F